MIRLGCLAFHQRQDNFWLDLEWVKQARSSLFGFDRMTQLSTCRSERRPLASKFLYSWTCRYNLEASRCHDYREGINEYFTCPQGYESQMERVVAQMVEKTHEVFCEGAGTAMIS